LGANPAYAGGEVSSERHGSLRLEGV